MINTIIKSLIKNYDLTSQSTLIIGLSGGPDSVFLLHVLVALRTQIPLTLIAAHLNHEWRESALDDAQLCQQLCASYGVTLVSAKASELNIIVRQVGSQEDYGRRLRRVFFETLAQQHNAQHIVLAHHADDQQETFFIRLLRGATLSGLVGMRESDGLYLRPLLKTYKADILAFLHEHQISYAIDPTNEQDRYLRNRIRHHLIPALNECDTRFAKTFEHTREQLQETEDFLVKLTDEAFNRVTRIIIDHAYLEKSLCVLDVTPFCALDMFMQKRVIVAWLIHERVSFTLTTSFITEIMRFIISPRGGAHQINEQWMIVKKAHQASIIRH